MPDKTLSKAQCGVVLAWCRSKVAMAMPHVLHTLECFPLIPKSDIPTSFTCFYALGPTH
jgi:hypothetical protein